jgi:MFS transporter, DHA2 family, multidrug resistance protein
VGLLFPTPSTLARLMRPAYVMTGGLLVAVIGLLLLSRLDGSDSLTLLVIGQVIMSLGFGPTVILGIDMIVGTAPPERAGAASAISETGQEFGFAIGVAVLGSIGTAVYRGQFDETIPGDVPASAAETSRETLAGALEVAATLPTTLGTELVNAATQAFTRGLQVNALIAAALTIGAAFLPVLLLRHVQPSDAAEEAVPGDALAPELRAAEAAAFE